jgi:hypothetical protein
MATLGPAQFPISQRDAFLVPSGAAGQNHIFFVLTDPSKHDSILMVNATTLRPGAPHDSSCLVGVGDHPFFQQQSYILYAEARIVTQQNLRTQIAAKNVIFRPPPLGPAVFNRLVLGTASPHLAPTKKAFFDAHQ